LESSFEAAYQQSLNKLKKTAARRRKKTTLKTTLKQDAVHQDVHKMLSTFDLISVV
jgi:hypothetical protein